jgi:surface antigen
LLEQCPRSEDEGENHVRKFLAATVAAIALIGGTFVAGVQPASAVGGAYLCTTYAGCNALGMGNHGYSKVSSTEFWRMSAGHNCTNYAAYLIRKAGGPKNRPWDGNGNATAWGYDMAEITDGTPAVGSIAWWGGGRDGAGSLGHVAYVEAVPAPGVIIVSEDTWGGEFYWKAIRSTDATWPTGFIHFHDAGTDGKVPAWRAVPSTVTYSEDTKGRLPVDPEHVPQGSTVYARVRLVNSGTATWSGVRVAPTAPSVLTSDWASMPTAGYATTDLVESGQTATFVVPVTVPADAANTTPFTLDLQATGPAGEVIEFGSASLTVTADNREPLLETPRPYLIGIPVQGETLSADPGVWEPLDTALTYQWERDGVAISGATAATYVLQDADVAHTVSVSVTGTLDGYIPATTESQATTAVESMYPRKLRAGERLRPGDQLVSANAAYRLLIRKNGAVAIVNRSSGEKVWSSGKVGATALKMRSDGRLVALSSGKATWRGGPKSSAVKAVLTGTGKVKLETAGGATKWASR